MAGKTRGTVTFGGLITIFVEGNIKDLMPIMPYRIRGLLPMAWEGQVAADYSLHRHRIIHRDIKPENIMLLENGKLKLLDLGVSRLPGLKDGFEDTAPGTPSYMAPEMFSGEQGDERSDLYALGATIYRMFSGGHYPYGEVEPFTRPRFDNITPLSKYRPDLPSWLDSVVTKATRVERRFSDAMDLAVELENGLTRGATTLPLETAWYKRNPVRFWQLVSLVLFSLLLLMIFV